MSKFSINPNFWIGRKLHVIVFSFASCKQWSTKEKSEHFTRIHTLLPIPLLLFPSSSLSLIQTPSIWKRILHFQFCSVFQLLLVMWDSSLLPFLCIPSPMPRVAGAILQLEGKAKKKPDLLPLHLYVHYLLLFLNIFKIFFCIHFAVPTLSCGMWDLLTAACELLVACRI